MAERRESVRLELNDAGFSTGMVKAAAATGLTERALKSLDGTTVHVHQSLSDGATSVDNFGRSAREADGSINQLTGRLRVLGEVAAILGPALTPIGGVAVAGVAGLANQLGVAAIAGGVLIGSMQGLGDALGAMNKAQLEPTDKNLEKAADALKALSPAARDFAREAFALKPALVALRDIGAESLFPGLSESLESLVELGPRVGGIMEAVAGALGDIASDSAASLASERWAGFFEFIQDEAPSVVTELAATVGDLTHGLAELWMAFTPLNNDFSSWLMDVAAGFDDWATGLDQTQGFQEFIEYVRETGPQVADTFAAIANALVQIVQATAPLGGPVLSALEGVAKAVGAIADSDLGAPILAGVAALSLLNRTLAVTASLSKVSLSSGLFAGLGTVSGGIKKQSGSIRGDIAAMSDTMVAFGANTEKAGQAAERMKGRLTGIAKGGAALGGLALASSGAADGLGLTNTASLALMGTMAGPWGIAIGAGAGLLLDWKAAGDQAAQTAADFETRLKSMSLDQLNQELETTNTLLATKPGVDEDEGAADREDRAKLITDQIAETKALEAAEVGRSRRAALAYASEVGLNADLAQWRGRSVEDIKAQADALAEVQKQAAATGESFLGLGDSLNDSTVSLSQFIKDMQESANALLNFNANSLKAARRGLDEGLIASLRAAGEEGALRMRQLANATESEIGRANKAHRSQTRALEQTADIAIKLAGLSPVVKVKAETANAMRDIEGLEARLRNIKDEDVNIVVRQIGATTLGPRPGVATGGHITGPGTGTSDSIPAYLSNGEFVIKAAAVKHYGADTFHGLNAMRFAEGGSVDRKGDKSKPKRYFSLTDNSDSLQAAIDRLTMVAEDQTRAVEDSTAKTEQWASRMEDAGNNTLSTLGLDLWGSSSDPWAAGSGSGPLFNLTNTNSGIEQRIGLQQQLADLGLSGEALSQLLTGTNAQISGVINRGEVGQYAQQFAQYQALSGAASAQAGQLAFGAQFEESRAAQEKATAAQLQATAAVTRMESKLAIMAHQLERFNNEGPERTGDAVGRVINGAAATGFRRGVNGGNR